MTDLTFQDQDWCTHCRRPFTDAVELAEHEAICPLGEPVNALRRLCNGTLTHSELARWKAALG